MLVNFFSSSSIGAVLDTSSERLESILRQTINRINLDKSRVSKARFEAQVKYINKRDSFHAKKVGQYAGERKGEEGRTEERKKAKS